MNYIEEIKKITDLKIEKKKSIQDFDKKILDQTLKFKNKCIEIILFLLDHPHARINFHYNIERKPTPLGVGGIEINMVLIKDYTKYF